VEPKENLPDGSQDCPGKYLKMRFYHRTEEDTWKEIQKEGILWGKHKSGRRYTYLSPIIFNDSYGPVLLKVYYSPAGVGSKIDNYGFDPPPGMVCWQFSVFVPIDIKNVRRC